MILAIRTDSPEAELYLQSGERVIAQHQWTAGRQLSQQLLTELERLLAGKSLAELTGIIVFAGPGSFTGLRIGVTVANTLAYALNIPVVATMGEGWRAHGAAALKQARPGQFVVPEYGALPNISTPKK